MCNVCCRELRGWCRSFTGTESLLVVLEGILLVLCVAFTIFLILHLVACSIKSQPGQEDMQLIQNTTVGPDVEKPSDIHTNVKSDVEKPSDIHTSVRPDVENPSDIHTSVRPDVENPSDIHTTVGPDVENPSDIHTTVRPDVENTSDIHTTVRPDVENTSDIHTTVRPDVDCTWQPSHKTAAPTRYYERDDVATGVPLTSQPPSDTTGLNSSELNGIDTTGFNWIELNDIDDLALEDQSDGEYAGEGYSAVVLALVRLHPPRGITFGCTLTAVSERWTLTAASCVHAVEEVASCVMLEGYGACAGAAGRAHAVRAVVTHPRAGAGAAHDVAALRCAGRLRAAARLPAPKDYLLITIGERLTLLGFGGFRSITVGGCGRGLREVAAYALPARQCAAAASAAGALCAGALYARGAPCRYCAGAALARGGAVLGVQAGARACGAACEPALYANLALLRDWIDALLLTDD